MECIVGFSHTPATVIFNRSRSVAYASKTYPNKIGRLRAKVNDENDPLLQTAINAASLRLQETHQPGKPISLFLSLNDAMFSFKHFIEQLAQSSCMLS